jgi:uncharacterized protein (TIGR02246 family)
MTATPEEIATGFAAAWNAADAGLLSEFFTEDADFVNVVGLWWRTRAQIRDNHAYGFRHMFPHTVMTLNKVTTRELGPDAAVVHAAWTLTGQITPTGQPAGNRSGVLSFTLSRQVDGHWLAVSAQNTDKVPGAQTYVAAGDTLTPENYNG